jgi:roadblock/LC7 domain-containing protein
MGMFDFMGGKKAASPPAAARPAAPAKAAPPKPAPDPWGLPPFLASLRQGARDRLSDSDIAAAAARIGCEGEAIRAVLKVECNGPGFGAEGLPIIRFEPHVFCRLTAGKFDAAHPDISYPKQDPRKYPPDQAGRYQQLAKAFTLDPEAAVQAASWGLFQIMGQNFKAMGHPAATALVADMAKSEARQLAAFEAFCAANGLLDELKAKQWTAFAGKYNGPRFRDSYGAQLEAAYQAFRSQRPSV